MGHSLKAGFIFLLLIGGIIPALAQGAGGATQSPQAFVVSAHSSAMLQQKISEIAASRDIRPQVRQFAQEMVAFRGPHIQRLTAAAAEAKVTLEKELTFEQQVIVQNLEPLDFLALARRYIEVQIQALEQEIRAYEAASSAAQPMTGMVGEYLPQLREKLEKARAAETAAKVD